MTMYNVEYTITEFMQTEAEDKEQAEYFAKEYLEDIGEPYEILNIKEIN